MVYQNENKFYLRKAIGSIQDRGGMLTIQNHNTSGINMFRLTQDEGRISFTGQLGKWTCDLIMNLWPDDVPF